MNSQLGPIFLKASGVVIYLWNHHAYYTLVPSRQQMIRLQLHVPEIVVIPLILISD